MSQALRNAPKTFVSYSWDHDEHRRWVRDFAARLRGDGVDVVLDQWHAAPGDQLPEFMERSVRENDYVLIICTPRYKEKSDGRLGGVGYEGDIMTAEALLNRTPRKFIPILRSGDWRSAAPSWLIGKYYIDLRGDSYSEEKYQDLLTTLHGRRPQAPAIGPAPDRQQTNTSQANPQVLSTQPLETSTEAIRIVGVVVDQITTPRNDGTRGSALYAIPFQLSRRPTREWAEQFLEIWDHPPRFTTMHRPGIARVVGDQIILDGTTIEEVERFHRDTLKLVVGRVNELVAERERERQRRAEVERQRVQTHKETVQNISNRLKFD